VRLRVRNTGDVVDEYRFEAVGSLAPWTVVEPPSLRLYPGTTGTVELTFAPPRTADATAGPNPYAVRITPTEHPEATTVPEGNLTITPFTEVRAELVPPTVKGRFRGKPRLAVDNLGNTPLTASLSGSDHGDHLSYDIHPSNVRIEPGRAAFVKTTLKPKQIVWFGSKEDRPYTLAVQRSGVPSLDVPGTYVQRSFLPRWLAAFLSVFLALAVALVMLWIAYKPQTRTAATELTQEAGLSTPAPSASASPEALKAPSAEAVVPQVPTETQSADAAGAGAGAGGGGGDSEEKKETRAPEETAATAVQQAAADDPGEQHICYRVYTPDQGWTDPVCDGQIAGTPGSGTALTAANIAVSGTNGTSGAAYVHDPASTNGEGYWPDPWTNAADGADNYVGSTDADAPKMLGFTINVDAGTDTVCQSGYTHDAAAWLALACDKPGDDLDLTYAGTYDNDSWIEAVKLTV
jgi:hypothetical protein